jgi:hypothetical protein
MFKFKDHFAEGVNQRFSQFNDDWVDSRPHYPGEVAVLVPGTADQLPMLVNYWLHDGQHHCRINYCAQSSPGTCKLTVPDGEGWLAALCNLLELPEQRLRLRAALEDWFQQTRKYLSFVRIPRRAIADRVIEVSGGVYREASCPEGIPAWSARGLTVAPWAEYWLARVPDENDRLFMFYDDDELPVNFEGSVDWAAFDVDDFDVGTFDTTSYMPESTLMLTVQATGIWTRMRTLYIEYLEIYEHDTGFEIAGSLLELLKATLSASGRDVSGVNMERVNVKTAYTALIDEVGFSDTWDEDIAWFEPLDWERFQAQDGIEAAWATTDRAVSDTTTVCVLRTTEPLAPDGDTKRMGLWYLYRASVNHPEQLVAVMRGEYDYGTGQVLVKRAVFDELGWNAWSYFEFATSCIRDYRPREPVDA